MREFTLSIVSAERTVLEEQVTSVTLPGAEGSFGVMAGHVPMVAELKIGTGQYRRSDGVYRNFTILGGFAEVLPQRTIVLADGAELDDEIDPDRARKAFAQARDVLQSNLSEQEMAEARLAYERARARLRARGEDV
ncbi:MAG: ATP synthase F1 subunit epsilon [Fimbriimonadia bacterium]|nr:ATP synthase F1 subunit epsilon [Fimbriimonadia bacterium]